MTWRRVATYFARRVQLGLFIIAIGFGLDYWFTPVGTSGALTSIEGTFIPLWAWGVTIVLCGVAGLLVECLILGADHALVATDERWRWGWVSNIAHAVLFGLFVALTYSSLADVVGRGIDTGHWYGWRTALMWGGYAYLNLLFVQRLRAVAK